MQESIAIEPESFERIFPYLAFVFIFFIFVYLSGKVTTFTLIYRIIVGIFLSFALVLYRYKFLEYYKKIIRYFDIN